MKTAAERLTDEFRCVKCQGRQAVAREVSLGSVAQRLSPGGAAGRYLLVSCALCGYTEVYNLSAIEKASEPEHGRGEAREPAG
jgi:predicted nucleic-acid-binding Zn-ribbon protein